MRRTRLVWTAIAVLSVCWTATIVRGNQDQDVLSAHGRDGDSARGDSSDDDRLSGVGQAAPPAATEKESRTPAQQKINSQLLYEIYRLRGEADRKGVPPGPTGVKIDARRRALIDVRAPVTAELQKKIRRLGGAVLSASVRDQSILARVPLLALERLAAEPAVRFIEPAAEAITVRNPPTDARRRTAGRRLPARIDGPGAVRTLPVWKSSFRKTSFRCLGAAGSYKSVSQPTNWARCTHAAGRRGARFRRISADYRLRRRDFRGGRGYALGLCATQNNVARQRGDKVHSRPPDKKVRGSVATLIRLRPEFARIGDLIADGQPRDNAFHRLDLIHLNTPPVLSTFVSPITVRGDQEQDAPNTTPRQSGSQRRALLELERIAAEPAVRFFEPAADAITVRNPL